MNRINFRGDQILPDMSWGRSADGTYDPRGWAVHEQSRTRHLLVPERHTLLTDPDWRDAILEVEPSPFSPGVVSQAATVAMIATIVAEGEMASSGSADQTRSTLWSTTMAEFFLEFTTNPHRKVKRLETYDQVGGRFAARYVPDLTKAIGLGMLGWRGAIPRQWTDAKGVGHAIGDDKYGGLFVKVGASRGVQIPSEGCTYATFDGERALVLGGAVAAPTRFALVNLGQNLGLVDIEFATWQMSLLHSLSFLA